MLLVTAAASRVLSEILVGSIEPFIEQFGLSELFVGVILIPTIGNLAEHLVAVQLAYKNKIEFSMAVAFGSSLQVALFVAPVLVLLGLVVGQPMDLVFQPLEIAAVARRRRHQRAGRARRGVQLARGRPADAGLPDHRDLVLRAPAADEVVAASDRRRRGGGTAPPPVRGRRRTSGRDGLLEELVLLLVLVVARVGTTKPVSSAMGSRRVGLDAGRERLGLERLGRRLGR